ncbi:MAG: thioredoxin domain-containing protein [Microthrixaceae bacterium]
MVDLWAPWCGPCKTLGPILDKVIAELGDRVVLAKINVDENPQASQMFRVQSIPAVFALVDRQVVNSFMGAQPEAKVAEFVRGLLPPDESERLEALVAAGDEPSLRAALQIDAAHEGARVALAKLVLADGRTDEALCADRGPVEANLEVRHVRAVAASRRCAGHRRHRGRARLAARDRVKNDDEAHRAVSRTARTARS